MGRYRYFQKREEWKVTDVLFNPMVMMMVLPLLIFTILPKMMQVKHFSIIWNRLNKLTLCNENCSRHNKLDLHENNEILIYWKKKSFRILKLKRKWRRCRPRWTCRASYLKYQNYLLTCSVVLQLHRRRNPPPRERDNNEILVMTWRVYLVNLSNFKLWVTIMNF